VLVCLSDYVTMKIILKLSKKCTFIFTALVWGKKRFDFGDDLDMENSK